MKMNDLAVFLNSDWFLILVAGVLGAALAQLISRRWQKSQLQADLFGKNFFDSSEKKKYLVHILTRTLDVLRIAIKRSKLPNDQKNVIWSKLRKMTRNSKRYKITSREKIFEDVDNLLRCLEDKAIDNSLLKTEENVSIKLGCDILRELKRIPMEKYIGEYSFNDVIITMMDKLPNLEDGVRKL